MGWRLGSKAPPPPLNPIFSPAMGRGSYVRAAFQFWFLVMLLGATASVPRLQQRTRHPQRIQRTVHPQRVGDPRDGVAGVASQGRDPFLHAFLGVYVCCVQVDVTVLSRGDLKQMLILKSGQLKAMALQCEGVRPHGCRRNTAHVVASATTQTGMHQKGGRPPHPPPGRPAYAQPLAPSRQVPASMAFVTDSNRPQPLWQPPPTACLTAAGAASEVPSLPMHPWTQTFALRSGRRCALRLRRVVLRCV